MTLGKAFVNITASEVLALLAFRIPPKIKEETRENKKQSQKTESRDTFGVQLEGLEFDFQFEVNQADILNFYSTLGERNSSIQSCLAYVDVEADVNKGIATSLGVNLLQVDFRMKSQQVPSLTVRHGDLVAKYMDG